MHSLRLRNQRPANTALFTSANFAAASICSAPLVFRALVLVKLVSAGLVGYHPDGRNTRDPSRHAWSSKRILAAADALRPTVASLSNAGLPNLTEYDLRQALLFSAYPTRISATHLVVYANKEHVNLPLLTKTSPFPVTLLSQDGDWKGTLDKLMAYWSFLTSVDDQALVVFVDAFDVFGNGFDGHELIRRYFSFGRPVILATEENVFPREVEAQAQVAVEIYGALGLGNGNARSRYVNAGGIIGIAWALKKMYNEMQEHMVARWPELLQQHADLVGHWFLHAYDQYELWRYFIRHMVAVETEGVEPFLALDTEQYIFGSTVVRRDNWPDLLGPDVLGGIAGQHSIDVDIPLVFDAPQKLWKIRSCHARFVGRKHFPIFWHGNGPWKPAWESVRDRLAVSGCFPESFADLAIYKMCSVPWEGPAELACSQASRSREADLKRAVENEIKKKK